jgi:hypothetical protein
VYGVPEHKNDLTGEAFFPSIRMKKNDLPFRPVHKIAKRDLKIKYNLMKSKQIGDGMD